MTTATRRVLVALDLLIATLEGSTKAVAPADDAGDDEARREIEARSERRIAAALRRQLRAALPPGTTVATLNASGGVEGAVQRAMGESKGLRDACYAMLVEAAHLGVDRGQVDTEQAQGVKPTAKAEIGLVDWTLVNTEARDWAAQYAGNLVQGIDETTQRLLRSAISEWINNDLSYAQLMSELSNAFGPTRAALIASTEVTRAYAEGSIQAWQKGGVISEMEWRTAMDERVCPVCGPLNGKKASVKDGFTNGNPPAHPRCLPGYTRVSSRERITSSSERWYDGDLVVVHTASGNRLACTPNHPILTPGGWVAAGLLNVGDHVVSSGAREWVQRVGVDDQDVPARVEDVAKAFLDPSEMVAVPVPVSSVDFHGDGLGSEVAVVRADRLLGNRDQAPLGEHLGELDLGRADVVSPRLVGSGVGELLLERDGPTPRCVVCGRDLSRTAVRVHPRPLESLGGALVADWRARFQQAMANRPAVHAVGLGDGVLRLTGEVAGGDLSVGQRNALGKDLRGLAVVVDGYSEVSEASADDVLADAQLAADLCAGAAGPVFTDEVVRVERDSFSGHVYNLQTVGGWYAAEGIITHNCRCWVVPVVVTPAVYPVQPVEQTQPMGTPVSGALTLPGGTLGQRIAKAVRLVDSVHGDGNLPTIGVRIGSSRTKHGQYNYAAGGQPVAIDVSRLGNHPELTSIHEIGHFLDHRGVVTSGQFASSSNRFSQEWLDAVKNSRAYQELANLRHVTGAPITLANGTIYTYHTDSRYVGYLMQRDELFARSYAQYIATKTRDATLLAQLDEDRRPDSIYHWRQWDDEDFKPILVAFDKAFKGLGWLT